MDGKMLTRLGAIVFVAVAITATAIELTWTEEAPVAAVTPPRPTVDVRRAALRRCQQLGQDAANDPDCLAAWAESRARFLGRMPAAPRSSEGH